AGGLGLKKIKGTVNSSFLVIFCDIFFSNFNLEELWKQHLRHKGIATLLLNTIPPLYSHKEVVAKIRGNQIIEIRSFEKNQFLPYFSGVFVAEPDFFNLPEKFRDVFPALAKKGLLTSYIESVPYLHLHTLKEAKRLYKNKKKY
ncbi:MAG: hypothetical protein NTY48_04140, partial [Candidatus Diapherotrites archaeon]|nr:hypothetical protein [Candidatus Diapherotrites archaeon]